MFIYGNYIWLLEEEDTLQWWSPFCDPRVNENDMERREDLYLEEIENR